MVQNPPEGYQRIIPYMLYEDAAAALEFVCNAFGFEERMRMAMPDGKIGHAEVEYEGNVVMLATAMSEMDAAGPKNPPVTRGMILVYVDDVDGHFAHAKEAGAKILSEPEDKFYGDRSYGAEDPEGYKWYFATHVRDVAPEDMKPPA